MVLSFDLSLRGLVSVSLVAFVVNLLATPLILQSSLEHGLLAGGSAADAGGFNFRQLQDRDGDDDRDGDRDDDRGREGEEDEEEEARMCVHYAVVRSPVTWDESVAHCRSMGAEVCTDADWSYVYTGAKGIRPQEYDSLYYSDWQFTPYGEDKDADAAAADPVFAFVSGSAGGLKGPSREGMTQPTCSAGEHTIASGDLWKRCANHDTARPCNAMEGAMPECAAGFVVAAEVQDQINRDDGTVSNYECIAEPSAVGVRFVAKG